ncbi:MAG: LTA synthase family protein [Phascolarctobacterium sp.]|nr:LTA synthase family protein [Phascolarctobacterium sp.]
MNRFAKFFEGLQQDLKAFAFWCVVFSIFRFAFIAIYSSQIEGLFSDEVFKSMWLGLRLSLKTTGILVLVGGVFATLPGIFCKNWPAATIRMVWHGLATIFFAVLFFTRIPYYQIFNAGFNMMIINGMHDDKYAILMTAIDEYQMLWRLPAAIVTGLILAYILKVIFKTPVIKFADVKCKKVVAVCSVLLVSLLWVFVRYGGAFTYSKSINWESAARLKSNLLNEAILDDGQALYRVYAMKRKLAKDTNVNITVDELKKKIAVVGGNPGAATIDEAFKRKVVAPKIAKQPNNIVLIAGESFGLWPFLPQFKDLGLVDQTIALQNSEQGFAIENMLAGASGTMPSMNVLLTGLPNTGIYENYQPNSFQTKYQMGIGYVMKKMGYKTIFWFGGFGGWQNFENMVLAQSFDEFRCADEFKYSGGNSWGCPDADLFKEISKYIAKQGDEKVFHMVLTTNNHPPFIIDVDKEGFKRSEVMAKLPADIKNDPKTITELGHIWYTDKVIGEFVKTTEAEEPDSLFIITGDHSERFHFAKEQNTKTRTAIPCVFYGAGINKEMFSNVKVGVHNQIAGTIAELIAPAGFEYSAMLESMFKEQVVYNGHLYATEEGVNTLNQNKALDAKVLEAKKVAAWRVLKEK